MMVRAAACAGLALLALPLPAQEPRFAERIEISRVVIDARVLDPRGRCIPGLTTRDFRVRVDGQIVPLESVDWIAAGPSSLPDPEPLASGGAAAGPSRAPSGRLIVLFFQKDLGSGRLPGLIQMSREAAGLVDTFTEQDRVAVVLFDSHLRLFLDFTADRDRLKQVLSRRVLREWPRSVAPGPFPSLAAHLDRDAARRAASPETALLVLARALKAVPGAKTILYFGWGFGRLSGPLVLFDADYGPAREALVEARAAVISLDVTDADYHTLEVGLERVALDTGGFYAKTHDFPLQAMDRVEGALGGHYVLSFESPVRRRGAHSLEIGLVGRKGTVLARNGFVD